MLVSSHPHEIEVHQVSARGYEVRKAGKVVRRLNEWSHDENRQGAMYEAENQVARVEMVAQVEMAMNQD